MNHEYRALGNDREIRLRDHDSHLDDALLFGI
jgi:hypothetical protein